MAIDRSGAPCKTGGMIEKFCRDLHANKLKPSKFYREKILRIVCRETLTVNCYLIFSSLEHSVDDLSGFLEIQDKSGRKYFYTRGRSA